nr:uncharacterized mitochondrial protein AtMg00810-like [Tanacetum cinerariifolium]
MNVKSAFLNGKLKEEVYVKQPPGFESSEFPDYVCKLDKAIYGLKQAPRAWYETLSTFLFQNKFARRRIDNTLFIYKSKGYVLLVQVYVDDIIFGSTSYKLCKQFKKLMTKKFKISMMGELTYFLGMQIKQDDKGISIYQEQYTWNLLKKHEISDSSSVKSPMVPPNNLGPDLAGKPALISKDIQIQTMLVVIWTEKAPQVTVKYLVGNWEFWSIAVAFDLFPSTNEPEKRLLKEFLIKFSLLNKQRPLTLDFQIFCSSTGLDYNNGKYVEHPTPEVVKKELGKITIYSSYLEKTPVLKNSFHLLAYSLITGTKVDIGEIIYSLDYTQDKKFRFLPPILSNSNFTKYPSKVTKIELTTHVIDVNNRRDSMSPPPLAAKPKKRKSQTVTSTSPQSQGPKASGALSKKSKRPKDITFTTPDEDTTKTTPRPEGLLGDKDSRGNKPPADIEPLHPTDADLSGTSAKYQEDQTQPFRLRYQSLTRNEGEC